MKAYAWLEIQVDGISDRKIIRQKEYLTEGISDKKDADRKNVIQKEYGISNGKKTIGHHMRQSDRISDKRTEYQRTDRISDKRTEYQRDRQKDRISDRCLTYTEIFPRP